MFSDCEFSNICTYDDNNEFNIFVCPTFIRPSSSSCASCKKAVNLEDMEIISDNLILGKVKHGP